MNSKHIKTALADNNYEIFGTGKVNLIIEIGLGSTMGEWHSIAKKLSAQYTVLLYERNRSTITERTPERIAKELHALLDKFSHCDKVIILAHSQGGLYAQQYARLYPDEVEGIVLIDPLSASDNEYKTVFTPEEQKKSGFNKSYNMVIMEKLAKLHLGFLIRAVMKKAPPFYYYNDYSDEERKYILSSISKSDLYTAAIQEYRLAHETEYTKKLMDKEGFPNIPIALITHSEEFSIQETMEFGRVDRDFAEKVEGLWQRLMQSYLQLSDKTAHFVARNSGHYLHLTETELIDQGLSCIAKLSVL